MLPVILITGCEGQLGAELVKACASLGRIHAVSRAHFDLSDFESMRQTILDLKPQLILNAAAYTAVDKAESEVEHSNRINGMALEVMGHAAKQVGAAIVHYSTDYVFDGTKQEPYVESDQTNPINQYGCSKLLGEECLRASGALYLNFRISWIYASRGKNFLLTMLRLAKERETLSVVNDQYGAPTSARAVAALTAQVLTQGQLRMQEFFKKHQGIYHLTCGGKTTWFEFANEIFKLDANKNGYKLKNVLPILSSAYPAPAKRPQNSVLDNRLFEKTFGLKMPHWTVALQGVMKELEVR